MTHLGLLAGSGRIRLADKDLGEAKYRIDVYRPRNLIEGRGTIYADDGKLWDIHESRENAILELEDGGTVEFLITRAQVGSGQASIVISGPIPGF